MNETSKPVKRATTTKPAAASKTAKKAPSAVATKTVKTKASTVAANIPATTAAKSAAVPRRRKAVEMTKPILDEGQRAQYVSVAAYYIAERRGFNGSYELADWVQAETQIDNLLREGKLSS